MSIQEFGPRRTRATSKPLVSCPEAVFYRCCVCGRVMLPIGHDAEAGSFVCCGAGAEVLKSRHQEDVKELLKLDYKITGGYNDNAVSVSFKETDRESRPEWFYLKTFTGGYLRFVSAQKHSPMIFPLADEDAYVYCDEDPCLECTFRCKRGFVIYCYSKKTGLIEVPLDRMTAKLQERNKQE